MIPLTKELHFIKIVLYVLIDNVVVGLTVRFKT